MAQTDPRGRAPRVHGELIKFGVDVSQATVAEYIGRRDSKPSSKVRQTFRAN